MDVGKEILLVCFLGDPSVGSAELPRVVLAAGHGKVEEVALSPGPDLSTLATRVFKI